ncbi:erythrocyte membrane protein 1, PfEMP1, putative [Plasmodium sp.]|nr:erythrocyte membrane protein 1, PfEMP1, putative [Plasmodium sp.]
MAPQPSKSPTYSSVKDLLEKIGAEVQEEAHRDAVARNNAGLKGALSKATYPNDTRREGSTPTDPCQLNYQYHTNVTSGGNKEYPCGNGTEERFSDSKGAECDNSKIEGSDKTSNGGACAPLRRLHLCDRNLQNINNYDKINNTHNLLLEVCLAAKHEGESLVKEHEKYKETNRDSQLCTLLTRSFADIGDIIRGKDLYLGDNKKDKAQKLKLQDNLKEIFMRIQENEKNKAFKDLSLDQIREYWWALNRDQVWKAITCDAGINDKYTKYHGDGLTTYSVGHCGHHEDKKVPTNLDYIPQYLRWFEEWSEEFCRKRNNKLKLAKDACRDGSQGLYCSHNGFACTQLIRNKDACSKDPKCTPCSNKCVHYDFWLRNQGEEFQKQKTKYTKEIEKYISSKGISNSNINNKYYEKFYKKLIEENYEKADDFLKLLNNGKYCKKGVEGESPINFTITGVKDAFYRSDYCQVCPDCVVECDGGKCEEKKKTDGSCKEAQINTRVRDETPTPIKVLFSGDNQKDITEKLCSFCRNPKDENDSNYQTWKCYYKSSDYNICEMKGSSYKNKQDPNIIISDECFHLWVKNLLIDTIKWETKLKKCINNTNVTNCYNGCKGNCECFENWVEQKEKEWEKVKNVYKVQTDSLGIYYKNLKNLFDTYYFEVMGALKNEEKHGKWNQLTAKLEQIIESSKQNTDNVNSQDTIKLLLEHLKENATTCIDNNSNESCENSGDSKTNPCSETRDSKSIKSVKHIAEMMQRDAREQFENGAGEIKLKGDASKGEYKHKGTAEDFKKERLCKISKDHSNRNDEHSKYPCYGKDGGNMRFEIGTPWQGPGKVNTTYKEVYLPPRREHMCTSNLEYLETGDGALKKNDGKLVNNSFLGDVMLSAKMDAEKIIQLYKQQNGKQHLKDAKDQATVCRAIKYSFADIGDIIKGRDMWDKDDGSQKMETILKNIFGTLHKTLDDIKENPKYKKEGDSYTKLREDWWEANRHQVWRAMKCAIKEGKIEKCNGIPIEDYIPQRLRWMTELAEWYCKVQEKAYEVCKRSVIKSNPDGKVYMEIPQKCKEYNKKIVEWKKQWIQLRKKYSNLYAEAQIAAGKGGLDNYKVEEKDKSVIEFLYDLHVQNGGKLGSNATTDNKDTEAASTSSNTMYHNVGAYLYDTWDFTNCKNKTEFCKSGKKLKVLDEEPHENPCGGSSRGSEVTESAKNVAHEMHDRAKQQMKENIKGSSSNKSGKNVLEADATKGTYIRGGSGDNFKEGKLCTITKNDSNDGRRDSTGPCYGKDGGQDGVRMKIGTPWTNIVEKKTTSYEDVFLPPRREHMCTSNLENLDVDSVTKGGKAIHSLLGDVQLAAKMDSQEIITRYKSQNSIGDPIDKKHQESICRAIRYSFADLGDIIRGRDMWDLDKGSTDMETKLKAIFKNIKEQHSEIQKQYRDDDNGKYTKLREDWWEANRRQVWRAMQCSLKTLNSSTGDCYYNSDNIVPMDDYIPQRLRWMTEWAEWFCKMQKEEYNKLVTGCTECKSKDDGKQCMHDDNDCDKCKKACTTYGKEIQKWQQQWKQMKKKYEELYERARVNDADNGGIDTSNANIGDKDKKAIEFLFELYVQNGGNIGNPSAKLSVTRNKRSTQRDTTHVYSTAEGYVHQELRKMGCMEQDVFCNESADNYAFKETATKYKDSCNCKNHLPKPPCEIVKDLFESNDNKHFNAACSHKYTNGGKPRFTQWKCINDSSNTTRSSPGPPHAASSTSLASPVTTASANSANSVTSATCIPPRRQQMYIQPLQSLSGNESQVELRTKFIETAAIETFFQWHKYIKEKEREKEEKEKEKKEIYGDFPFFPYEDKLPKPQEELNSGTIPEDFKRQMFYTFGDYRDLCLENDIGKDADTTGISDTVKRILSGKTPNGQECETWWSQNAKAIWDGMVCALSYNTDDKKEIQGLRDKLIKPDNKNDYNRVTISSIPSGDTKLTDFVKRPTFFRWLEEWGEEFCKKRKRNIDKIKHECRSEKLGRTYCSGDGYDCEDGRRKYNDIFAQLDCRDCHEKCRNYKKWIKNKEKEFDKHKNKYGNEIEKLINNYSTKDHDKKFYEHIKGEKNYISPQVFLASLNHCKQWEDEKDQINKTDFNKPLQTFSPSTYCKVCPLYGVHCRATGECTAKAINNENDTKVQPTDINILVDDSATKQSDDKLQKDCKTYELYKDLSKQQWTCQKKKDGTYECNLSNVVDNEYYDDKIPFNILFHRWLIDFIQYYNKSKKEITRCTKKGENKCDCIQEWLNKKSAEWKTIKQYYKDHLETNRENITYTVKMFFQQLPFERYANEAKTIFDMEMTDDELWGCNDNFERNNKQDEKQHCDFITKLISELQKKIDTCKIQPGETQPNCEKFPSPVEEEINPLDDDTDTTDIQKPLFCPTEEEETLCDDKQEPKCDNFKNRFSNSKCEPKTNLIGLNAYNRRESTNPNVYISPRVQQLCLQPLINLTGSLKKSDSVTGDKFSEALQECAYNEAKSLYQYYKGEGKKSIPLNNSVVIEDDIKEHTLEAMKRSYADYANIVKGYTWWIYPHKKDVDTVIISVAENFNGNIKSSHVPIDEDAKRLNLWKYIRNDIWKAMLCGYKKAGGCMKNLPNGGEFCTLPSTDDEDQFSRWFKEWGENFCIRRDQELKQLKDKCKNGICNSTDEGEKQECKSLCGKYWQFLSSSKTQYEKQSILYNQLKESTSEFEKKDPFKFLKEKCNLKYCCFKNINTNKINDIFKYPSDEIKDICDCKKEKTSDYHVNDLDKCPTENKNNNICNKYKKRRMCGEFKYSNSLDNWYGRNMLIPPRRRHLCLRNIIIKRNYRKGDISIFKDDLLSAVANETKFLLKNYENKNEALQAIKYTFADIGDIIKGNDMMDDTAYKKINIKLQNALDTTGNDRTTPDKWWDKNKKHVWNVMLCVYNEAGGNIIQNDCDIPSEENTHQFLRWLTEWGTQYCKEKQQLKSNMQMPCKSHFDKYGIIEKRNDVHPNCLPNVEKYEIWINNRLPEWNRLSNKFDELKSTMKEDIKDLTAYKYLKKNCSKCICSFKDIEQTHKKSKDEGYHIYEDILDKAQIPSFLEDIAYRYKGIIPECPENIECSQYENIPCSAVSHDDDNDWNSSFVKDNKKTNMGVLLPPRRKQVCLRIDVNKFLHLRNDINNLKKFICKSAFAEAKRLKKVYKDDNSKLHQAMKYSFSDIGSVVKGNDMMESPTSEYMDKLFTSIKYSVINRKKWWNENKYYVWESMLCGYREAGGDTKTSENCRFPDIESVPQFLRWFQEWTKIFCIKRKTLYDKMVTECQKAECDTSNGTVKETKCTEACEEYKSYVLSKKKEYDIQKDKYDKEFKKILNNKDAPKLLKVPCLSEYFNEKNKWENPYESITNSKLKQKCDCKKIEHPPPVVPDTRPPPPPPKSDELPAPADQPFDPTILQTTIPFGVALALGSIAFLFLKKKTQTPVDLFSVIDIPKGDYDMPTLKSSNRYIPYASDRYKGKTYIYIEGDSSGDEKYAFMSDTTDVTSSESEYEELDINDIYVPGSPKYKTLIEVVLEPSKRDTPSSDTPINKFTDDEWNQLKHDFISNMLQSQPNDVPNDYRSENVTLNTQPNTLYFDKPEEKPFITSIHDRNLYSGEEYSYNVNMVNNDNIPINRDNNHVYSGIDLINDSLNNNNVDIYDELLKRKENELFGTNHTKHTNTHNVTKSSNSDPIDNQLDFFHTWLDRHRDMCEKWNNKEDVLDKLKEEWNKDNNSGDIPSDSNKTLNTDVSIQIHMDNPKPINQFTNMDSILEDLEKYNEPYYDVQDDIYYDVHDHDTSTVDSNAMDVPSKVQIEMDVNTKLVKEKYPIADVWDI